MAFIILDMYPGNASYTFFGNFFQIQNNALCYNMLNRLHVLYIYVSTNCQEEFVLSIEYIYIMPESQRWTNNARASPGGDACQQSPADMRSGRGYCGDHGHS